MFANFWGQDVGGRGVNWEKTAMSSSHIHISSYPLSGVWRRKLLFRSLLDLNTPLHATFPGFFHTVWWRKGLPKSVKSDQVYALEVFDVIYNYTLSVYFPWADIGYTVGTEVQMDRDVEFLKTIWAKSL